MVSMAVAAVATWAAAAAHLILILLSHLFTHTQGYNCAGGIVIYVPFLTRHNNRPYRSLWWHNDQSYKPQATGAGTWSTSAAAIATVGSLSGVVTGGAVIM